MRTTLEAMADDRNTFVNGRTLARHWILWRGGGDVPVRSEIRPEDLGGVLASSMIMEVEDRERVVLRLAPSVLEERIGRSQRGVNFTSTNMREGREERLRRFWNAVSLPCGTFTRNHSLLADGRKIAYVTLMLPLTREAGAPPRLLIGSIDLIESEEVWREPSDLIETPPAKECTYVDLGFGTP